VAYCYRHSFITDALVRQVPIATVAELVGHASTQTIEKHYGHLDQQANYLKEAAKKATVGVV
jgi:integrase